jgi:D-alanyl-D-alanine dipeptidase
MGTAWDFFDLSSWSDSEAVSVEQQSNRALLRALMTRHGFRPLREEWWHFTLENEPYPETYFNFPVR